MSTLDPTGAQALAQAGLALRLMWDRRQARRRRVAAMLARKAAS